VGWAYRKFSFDKPVKAGRGANRTPSHCRRGCRQIIGEETEREVMDEDPKIPVYVEAEIRAQSRAKPGEIKERVEAMLKGSLTMFQDGPVDFEHDEFLAKNLQLLRITDISLSKHVRNAHQRVM
jgi:hypothetical protein